MDENKRHESPPFSELWGSGWRILQGTVGTVNLPGTDQPIRSTPFPRKFRRLRTEPTDLSSLPSWLSQPRGFRVALLALDIGSPHSVEQIMNDRDS